MMRDLVVRSGVSDEKRIPVADRVVVSRTRDGGSSFDVLTNELDREVATLVARLIWGWNPGYHPGLE